MKLDNIEKRIYKIEKKENFEELEEIKENLNQPKIIEKQNLVGDNFSIKKDLNFDKNNQQKFNDEQKN